MVNGGGFGDAVFKTNVCVLRRKNTGKENRNESEDERLLCLVACFFFVAVAACRTNKMGYGASASLTFSLSSPLSLSAAACTRFCFFIITLTELYTNLDDAGAPVFFHAKPVTLSSDLVRANTITGARRLLVAPFVDFDSSS